MSDIAKLGAKYPCCGRACTHALELGVPRRIACVRCIRRFDVVLVEGSEHASAMAGRPVAKVEWTEVTAA